MKNFNKKIEDFICQHCGRLVKGTGYTNHCPYCLWSRHEDVSPGDRAEECQGMMKPVDIYLRGQEWVIVHKCKLCGEERKNKVQKEDSQEAIIALQKQVSDKKMKG